MSKIYSQIPSNYGECPVCNGTGRAVYFNSERECRNCGGQSMFGTPLGYVPLRNDGSPCKHEYDARNAGRCYTVYTCKHCNYSYDIDSGD